MSSEFDNYSGNYDALLKDPIRDRFVHDAGFFHLRKWLLLQDFFRQRGPSMNHLRWLDVGCGKGELLRLGRSSFGEALGCDPSLQMLQECSGLDVRHQADANELPFDAASVDVVTAACVFHHLTPAERRRVTAEVGRVLRPGGFFVMFEHNPWNPATRLIVSRTPVDANAVLLTAREAGNLMRGADMTVVRAAYYLYLPQGLFSRFGGVERYFEHIPLGGQYAVFGQRT
jgi:ubiquinone/menaquinone biosynthesis C-methylase UbiE